MCSGVDTLDTTVVSTHPRRPAAAAASRSIGRNAPEILNTPDLPHLLSSTTNDRRPTNPGELWRRFVVALWLLDVSLAARTPAAIFNGCMCDVELCVDTCGHDVAEDDDYDVDDDDDGREEMRGEIVCVLESNGVIILHCCDIKSYVVHVS